MNPFTFDDPATFKVGTDAGWMIEFYRVDKYGKLDDFTMFSLGAGDYRASATATLPQGFSGGSYSITIENMTDAHYMKIAQNAKEDERYTVMKLYLYWRDTSGIGGYLASIAGIPKPPKGTDLLSSMVGVLKITEVTRVTGTHTYDAQITGVEWVYDVLANTEITEKLSAETYRAALKEIDRRTKVAIVSWPEAGTTMTPEAAGKKGSEDITLTVGSTCAQGVRAIAQRVHRGMRTVLSDVAIIRDATVHVGKRPIPYPEGLKPLRLSLTTGLLDTQLVRESEVWYETKPAEGPAKNTLSEFKMILKGRPDIHPGDLVEFDLPKENVNKTPNALEAIAGAFAGPLLHGLGGDSFENPKFMYVTSVSHKLGKTVGFQTTIGGFEVPDAKDPWGKLPEDAPATPNASGSVDPAAEAASAIDALASSIADSATSVEVAEVRAGNVAKGKDGKKPAQSELLWVGLEESDGRGNAARRLSIKRKKPNPLVDVTYLTPFAYGNTGLVLPRYPGTRVALTFRDGEANDPLELGAFWAQDEAPVSQAGDWWLSLPAKLDKGKRSDVADGSDPPNYAAEASHDLIDADGNRVIEVGQLTIRFGAKALHATSARPKKGADNCVTIEHADGKAKIVIDNDGKIQITGKSIALDAGDDGTISLNAKTVDVKVKSEMNVS